MNSGHEKSGSCSSTNYNLVKNGSKAGVEILVSLIGDDCQVRVINMADRGTELECGGHTPAHETQRATNKTFEALHLV